LIKSSSNELMEKLKNEMIIGFQKYYEELNIKVADELQNQESLQNELHNKIGSYENKITNLKILIEKRKTLKCKFLDDLCDTKRKAAIFRFLVLNKNKRKNSKIVNNLIKKFYNEKMKRKCLSWIKNYSVLQRTADFEEKMRIKTEDELKSMQEGLEKQKEELLNLILKAEEKLKHENRKKVQAKLQLDQIVLRGVSALNMKALKLSQNSLNGKNFIYVLFINRCGQVRLY
jgi:hypothetical protein